MAEEMGGSLSVRGIEEFEGGNRTPRQSTLESLEGVFSAHGIKFAPDGVNVTRQVRARSARTKPTDKMTDGELSEAALLIRAGAALDYATYDGPTTPKALKAAHQTAVAWTKLATRLGGKRKI